MPTLSRRKSTWRYCFLWPPPRCQTTISPWLFRPPWRFFGSSKAFSGSCLVMWLLSTTVINRREAVYGLKLFSPIAASYLLDAFLLLAWPPRGHLGIFFVLQILRVFDHLFAFRQLDVGFFPVAAVAFVLPAAAHFADVVCGAYCGDFHFENLLHSFLDLRLRGAGRNFKNHGVLRLFYAETFFGDDRPADNLIVRGRHRLFLPLFLGRFGGFLRGCRFLGCGLGRSFFLCGLRCRSNRFNIRGHDRGLFRIKRMAQARHGVFGKKQQVMFQHVVGLQDVRSRERYACDVAAGAFQIVIFAVSHKQRRLLVIQLAEDCEQRLGLVRFERPLVDDGQFLFRQLGGKRRAQRA